MSAKIVPVTIGLATMAFVVGYAQGELWTWTVPVLVIGVLWLLGQWRRWYWLSSVGLVAYAGCAAAGLLQGMGAGWMLMGQITALVAWDLSAFVRRMESVERIEGQQDLERRHLLWLLAVAALGLLLAAVALGLRLELGFGAILLLALLAILGVSRAIALLRREGAEGKAGPG
jgi:hypothetical protein